MTSRTRWIALALLLHGVVAGAHAAPATGRHVVSGCADHTEQADRLTRNAAPVIGEHSAPPSETARDGEAVRLVSIPVAARVRPPADAGPPRDARRRSGTAYAAPHDRWCDVTQCRRVGGIRLLGYATPPPRD